MSRSTTRRGSDRRNRSAGAIAQPPFRQLTLQYAPIAVISDDEVEAIHAMGLTVLEEIGMRVLASRGARALPPGRRRGRRGEMQVRFDRELVVELVAKAPPSFTLPPAIPNGTSGSAGATASSSSVGGPAYVMDNRSRAAHRHLCRDVRLSPAGAVLNILHQEGGGPFEPLDLPAEHPPSRSLLCGDHAASTRTGSRRRSGRGRAIDALGDGGDLARPLARESCVDMPVFTGIINTNSPLQLDVPMAEGLIALAEHGQVNVITPFTLAGAMCAGDARRRAGPAACRGAGRHRADPDRAAGRAGDVWRLHLQCRHEDRARRPSARRNIRRPRRSPASSRG